VTTTDAGLTSLVTQLGRARASAMDVPAVLGSICSAIPGVLGVGGAVLLLVNPPDGVPAITASDARALWLAETQQRTDLGPLAGALRTWRPMLTGDLTRIGPPAVAAAAVECGLGSSLVLPFDVDGDRVGVLQLLGEVQRPVEAAHAEVLRPLLDVLGARLADVRALRKVGSTDPQPARPAEAASSQTRPASAVSAQGHPADAPGPARPVVPPARSADSASSTGRIGPPVPSASDQPPDKPVAAARSNRPLIPAPRGGRHAEPPARKPRSGAHAAPDTANPSESTTSALPTVSPRLRGRRSSGRHSA
jgi:GAF domain/Inovirus Coat protein B